MFETLHVTPMQPRVVVCVPTLRRAAHLRLTLASIAAQDVADEVACLVADNDATGREGAAAAIAMMREGTVRGAVIVVPEPGNCSACSNAFAAARALYPDAPFVAMIDDDELATPTWLRRLLEAQVASGADLVGGPVEPRFELADHARFSVHPVFKPFYRASGPVPFLYGSGNFLMRSEVLDRIGAPYFDPAFNFVGGGDIDFFKRCRALGFTAYFESEALATETVPASRTTVRWVMARSLRYGAINYMLESKAATGAGARLRITLKSAALLGVGSLRAIRRLAASRNLLVASHPVVEAVGRVAAQLGRRPEQYRQRPSGQTQ